MKNLFFFGLFCVVLSSCGYEEQGFDHKWKNVEKITPKTYDTLATFLRTPLAVINDNTVAIVGRNPRFLPDTTGTHPVVSYNESDVWYVSHSPKRKLTYSGNTPGFVTAQFWGQVDTGWVAYPKNAVGFVEVFDGKNFVKAAIIPFEFTEGGSTQRFSQVKVTMVNQFQLKVGLTGANYWATFIVDKPSGAD